MKKILMILILVVCFGGNGLAGLLDNYPEPKTIEYGSTKLGYVEVLCVSGHKIAMAMTGGKSNATIIQIYEYDPKLEKVVPAKCK